jgi:hypothetical protein
MYSNFVIPNRFSGKEPAVCLRPAKSRFLAAALCAPTRNDRTLIAGTAIEASNAEVAKHAETLLAILGVLCVLGVKWFVVDR